MSDQENSEREKLERERLRYQSDRERQRAIEERDKMRKKRGPSMGSKVADGVGNAIRKLIMEK